MSLTRATAIFGTLLRVLVDAGCKEPGAPTPITVTGVSPASDRLRGGTGVTITGTNFVEVTSVTIGASELLDRTVVSGTEITGTVPGSTSLGAKDVVVTTSSHGSGTCGGCFTYVSVTAVAIGAGYLHTCGLTSLGGAYCWGLNDEGQLGDGSTDPATSTPIAVSGGLSFNVLAVGPNHNCGLTSAGAAYCWGYNYSRTPVAVSGGLSFSTLALGGAHTCGLTSAGAAYCWGDNSRGQLGNGSTTNSPSPVTVSGGLRFTALISGALHTCGVAGAGAAYCWGDNSNGQLGTGSTTNSSTPVAVSGGLSFSALAANAVSAGYYRTCGLTSAGAAYCWGENPVGLFGNGSVTSSSTPVALAGGFGFTALALGLYHTCALTNDGAAYCWASSTPVAVSGGLSFSALATGGWHACGLTRAEAAYCWGEGGSGQLGNDSYANSAVPVAVAGWP